MSSIQLEPEEGIPIKSWFQDSPQDSENYSYENSLQEYWDKMAESLKENNVNGNLDGVDEDYEYDDEELLGYEDNNSETDYDAMGWDDIGSQEYNNHSEDQLSHESDPEDRLSDDENNNPDNFIGNIQSQLSVQFSQKQFSKNQNKIKSKSNSSNFDAASKNKVLS